MVYRCRPTAIYVLSNKFKLNFNFRVSLKLNLQTLINWWQARAATIKHLLISVTRSLRLLLHTALIWSYHFYFKWMKQSQCLFVKCLQSCKMSWCDVMCYGPSRNCYQRDFCHLVMALKSWLLVLTNPSTAHNDPCLVIQPLIGQRQISRLRLACSFSPALPAAVYQCHQIFTNTPPWVYPGLEPHKHQSGPRDGWISTQLRSVAD